MVAILVEVTHLPLRVQEVEDSNLHHFHALRENFTEATGLREGAGCLFLFLFSLSRSRLCLRCLQSLNKLDLQHDSVAIVDVG